MTAIEAIGLVFAGLLVGGIGATLARWFLGGYSERNDAKRRNHR